MGPDGSFILQMILGPPNKTNYFPKNDTPENISREPGQPPEIIMFDKLASFVSYFLVFFLGHSPWIFHGGRRPTQNVGGCGGAGAPPTKKRTFLASPVLVLRILLTDMAELVTYLRAITYHIAVGGREPVQN